MTTSKIHNELAGKIVREIILGSTANRKYEITASLVLLESVALGVFLAAQTYGYPAEKCLDVMVEGIRKRLPEAQRKLRKLAQ